MLKSNGLYSSGILEDVHRCFSFKLLLIMISAPCWFVMVMASNLSLKTLEAEKALVGYVIELSSAVTTWNGPRSCRAPDKHFHFHSQNIKSDLWNSSKASSTRVLRFKKKKHNFCGKTETWTKKKIYSKNILPKRIYIIAYIEFHLK